MEVTLGQLLIAMAALGAAGVGAVVAFGVFILRSLFRLQHDNQQLLAAVNQLGGSLSRDITL